MRTLKLVAILGFNCAAECLQLVAAQLALDEIAYQARLRDERRRRKLKESGLPEYAQEIVWPQGGKQPREP